MHWRQNLLPILSPSESGLRRNHARNIASEFGDSRNIIGDFETAIKFGVERCRSDLVDAVELLNIRATWSIISDMIFKLVWAVFISSLHWQLPDKSSFRDTSSPYRMYFVEIHRYKPNRFRTVVSDGSMTDVRGLRVLPSEQWGLGCPKLSYFRPLCMDSGSQHFICIAHLFKYQWWIESRYINW